MDLNQFTNKSQEIISNAQQLTITSGHQAIENAHLLSAIIDVDKNLELLNNFYTQVENLIIDNSLIKKGGFYSQLWKIQTGKQFK